MSRQVPPFFGTLIPAHDCLHLVVLKHPLSVLHFPNSRNFELCNAAGKVHCLTNIGASAELLDMLCKSPDICIAVSALAGRSIDQSGLFDPLERHHLKKLYVQCMLWSLFPPILLIFAVTYQPLTFTLLVVAMQGMTLSDTHTLVSICIIPPQLASTCSTTEPLASMEDNSTDEDVASGSSSRPEIDGSSKGSSNGSSTDAQVPFVPCILMLTLLGYGESQAITLVSVPVLRSIVLTSCHECGAI